VKLSCLVCHYTEEKFGETAAATTANQAGDKIGKLPDAKMSDKPPLSRQSSRGSQNSGKNLLVFNLKK